MAAVPAPCGGSGVVGGRGALESGGDAEDGGVLW